MRLPRPNLAFGGLLVGLLLLAALLASVVAPYNPNQLDGAARLQAPSALHWLGTDEFGRDVFSRVLYGAGLAVKLSLLAVLLAAVPGAALGLVAGYRGGWLDYLLSRVMDAWLALPGLLLAIVLVARLRPSLGTVALALGLSGVPGYFRLVRAGALSAARDLHVEAARAIGAPTGRILLRHVLPTLTSPLVVLTTVRLGSMLLAAGGLSFIGLGAQPPTPVGSAAGGRSRLPRHGVVAHRLPRPGLHPQRPRLQPAGRRPAGRPRPDLKRALLSRQGGIAR